RSARGPRDKPIRAESSGTDRSWKRDAKYNYVVTYDIGTLHRGAGNGTTSSHHGYQDWSPRREHDISNGIGHRITEGREVALRLFLDRTKGSGDCPRAATSTQDNDGIHLQHITPEQDRHGVRENRDDNADKDQADPRLLEPRKKAGPCGKPNARHEDGQTHRVEDPHGGPWDPTKCRVDRAQPAEYQTHDQRAAAGCERERQPGNCEGEQSHEAAEDDPQTDEDHVRHHCLAVGVAELLGRALDVARGSDESHYIAPLHLRRGRERHRLASPGQLLQKDTARELEGRQLYNTFPDETLVGDHDVEHIDRKTQ